MKAIKWLAVGHILKYITFMFYMVAIIFLALENYWGGIPIILLTIGLGIGMIVIDGIFIFKALGEKDEAKAHK